MLTKPIQLQVPGRDTVSCSIVPVYITLEHPGHSKLQKDFVKVISICQTF